MDPTRLQRYRGLYRCATRMGSDRIFNSYIGASPDAVVPLSVSHGVDFGHLEKPMDIEAAEPIHWAYNDSIFEASRLLKPTILLPHPWLMHATQAASGPSIGTLIVAAPPGPENDTRLYDLIREMRDVTILVKPRGNYRASIDFWNEKGIRAISAGAEGPEFYPNLYSIISGAERVIGCNFSSALIFAAALGIEVAILENYRHRTYMHRSGWVNFGSNRVRSVVISIIDNDREGATNAAKALLTPASPVSPESARQAVDDALSQLIDPLYFTGSRSRVAKRLLTEATWLSGRTGILNNLEKGLIDAIFGRKVYATEIDELGLWRTGDKARHMQQVRVPYVRGVTEGGLAVDAYPNDRGA